MTDASAAAPDEGLPIENLQRLVAMGNIREGTVTVDEVLVALGSPEPTPDFVIAITELLANHNITVDPEEPAPVELHAPDDVLLAAPVRAAATTARRAARGRGGRPRRDARRASRARASSNPSPAEAADRRIRSACTSRRSVASRCSPPTKR